MREFRGKIAVVTGGGTGMGRELACQLVSAGAHVAICDVFADHLVAAKAACEKLAGPETRISTHHCDVSDESQVLAFRDAVLAAHETDHIHLLFNNAGIGGGGSFINEERARWDKTFNTCWFGVYYCARAFLPLLIKSPEGCIVNTSSINGIVALEPGGGPHTAYCSAKFAVKGFSEALLTDLRFYAPHVRVALVMPGHIGTSIVANTMRSLGSPLPQDMTADQVAKARLRLQQLGVPQASMSDEEVRAVIQQRMDSFRDAAPLSAAQAATVILNGVREGRWRILVGEDAQRLDRLAREHPDELYEPEFLERIRAEFASRPPQ